MDKGAARPEESPVRRFATVVPTVVASVVAALTLTTGTALAQAGGGDGPAKGSHAVAKQAEHKGEHGKQDKHGKKDKRPRVKPPVLLVGVVADSPTATIGSDTATSTITLTVPAGRRAAQPRAVVVTIGKSTVVRRAGSPSTAAALRPGDLVATWVRRMPDGRLLALRVLAWAPRVVSDEVTAQPL
jgi:hypothetical protein